MEKLVYFPYEVLETIFQQINHHMVLNLMPLHSKFYEIGQKKLYKFIHIYSNRCTKESWRFHKNISNDFTKKFTVISAYNFYMNLIEGKINRYQYIQHLRIEDAHCIRHFENNSFDYETAPPALLKEIVNYFKKIDFISFGNSNNQLELNDTKNTYNTLEGITFVINKYLKGFYRDVLFLHKRKRRPYRFLYNNLRSLKFHFKPSHTAIQKYRDDYDLGKSIDLFNKINGFKKLEELNLTFPMLVDFTDPTLLKKLNRINCKLKKLDLLFWGKLRLLEWVLPNSEPKKWLFTLEKYFHTEEVTSLTLIHYNNEFFDDIFQYDKFEFVEILTNANLPKLRNLLLSSHLLDLKSIDVSKLHKLIVCTGIANDKYAIEIAKLYFTNPSLKVCWWPRFMDLDSLEVFFKSGNLNIYSPEYYQIISCQWPSYFFENTAFTIETKDLTFTEQGLLDLNENKKMNISLEFEYSLKEIRDMKLVCNSMICEEVLKIIREHE
ncbi:uncharacterized protein KGF55_002696 [Candida pseudojiufengensis]|uniref:uncharacterized protein n=1 Tax=Candida pseudojiufengensis TaxID=497109 RepID=UPI00222560D0|nr:uncharacterized protein KGF55_002696 [Candida pseudojiufengensis]KAI5963816.1 hypothetical protein KGF55_002696 [Candida pseudojiufengensis]